MADFCEPLQLGAARSLSCFGELLEAWGLPDRRQPPKIIGIVGSKGKGSAAAAATYHAVNRGRRVVTVTSPHYLELRERVRIDGAPISIAAFEHSSEELRQLLRAGVRTRHGDGYLSLNGRITAIGMSIAADLNADLLVIEAGIGGLRDELSVCPVSTLAVTEIFAEHLGVIADTLEGIARDKLGIRLLPSVERAVSLVQFGVVDEVRTEIARTHPISVLDPWSGSDERADDQMTTGSLLRANVALGVSAALIAETGDRRRPWVDASVDEVVDRLRLPGRRHSIDHGGVQFTVDSAATPAGLADHLAEADLDGADYDLVILGCPLDRDLCGMQQVLGDRRVVRCHLDTPNYSFGSGTSSLAGAIQSARPGLRVLITGVVAFAAEAMRMLGCEVAPRWW